MLSPRVQTDVLAWHTRRPGNICAGMMMYHVKLTACGSVLGSVRAKGSGLEGMETAPSKRVSVCKTSRQRCFITHDCSRNDLHGMIASMCAEADRMTSAHKCSQDWWTCLKQTLSHTLVLVAQHQYRL